MTRKTFEAARDCTSKIKGLTPAIEKIMEMFSFLSKVNRLSELCRWEGPSGIRIEADSLPEKTEYEKAFKESIFMWMGGSSVDRSSDHAADRYFEADPSGYDAAIFFAAVFSVGNILTGELSYSFIDKALQLLLPDGWRWSEEDERESDAHKDDKDWSPLLHSHRKQFLGDPEKEIQHRFDDIKVCDLISEKDDIAEKIGSRIADRLPEYKDGALQRILEELTYTELERSLYVLPEKSEDRIMSNLSSRCIPIIKGHCILKKDSVSATGIRAAVDRFEEALNSYSGDPGLEAEYEDW